MEREFESKGLISKDEFELLLQKLIIVDKREQSNTYLDTKDGFFKQESSALRLRIIDNEYIFSLKRQDDDGATEWNESITKDIYDNIISTKEIDLSHYRCPQANKLTNLEVVSITTRRYVCQYNEFSIELDETTFNNTVDYEIEIEADSLDTANLVMKDLALEYDLTIKKSYPKIARYFIYN